MQKTNKFMEKAKAFRSGRAIYLAAALILLSLAIVFVVTAIFNRNKKNLLPTDTPADNDIHVIAQVEDTEEPTVSVVADVIPEFTLPAEGMLMKAHSADVPVFSETLKDYRVHLGVDIMTKESAPVCAAAQGTVKKIWEDPMMGWCVALSHSGDCVTVYKNLSPLLAAGVSEGERILAGQLIGYVGDSALCEIAEEPHLHLEMTVKGLQVNPLDYFSAAVISALSEDAAFEDSGNEGK